MQQLHASWRQHLCTFQQRHLNLALSDLPSLCDLERAFARVAAGKAIGQDGLPPELCRTHPSELARMSYSQLLKLALHGHESLHHKGGSLVQAWKGKGARDVCASYRSLLVSSHQGKALHRALRQHHSGLYESWLQSQQIGGRSHIPVGLGMHQVRSFLRIDKNNGRSSGILFLDLREAFYRVLRPLALQSDWNEEELAKIAQRLNLPSGTLHELHQHLQEPCAVAQAGLPHFIQNYITAIHTDTWFQMKHQHDFVKTTIGSRPGDCYADVVFGFLWSRVLKKGRTSAGESRSFGNLSCFNRAEPVWPRLSAGNSPHIFRPQLDGWPSCVCVCPPRRATIWLPSLDPSLVLFWSAAAITVWLRICSLARPSSCWPYEEEVPDDGADTSLDLRTDRYSLLWENTKVSRFMLLELTNT